MKQKQNSPDIPLPSSKVGIVLIVVVLIIVVTIFGSKIKFDTSPIKDLQNVDLVLERKTGDDFKTADTDTDGLPDWLEEFYKTDANNPDTDGDGTPDGEEVTLKRDPIIPGPNDPLMTREDMINGDADFSNFVPGTLTDKASVELFSEYLTLKRKGILNAEDSAKLVEEISKKTVEQASLKPKYSLENLNIIDSSKQTVSVYGDRVAQVTIGFMERLEKYKNLKDNAYLSQLSKEFEVYAEELKNVNVPSVVQEAHLELMNYIYNTSKLYAAIINADSDPFTSIVIISQFQTIKMNDQVLFSILADYFKNNGIIFDTQSTNNFWNKFEN